MNRTLVALLAIVAAVAIVALFAWAQDPTRYDGNIEATGTITGTTITASTGFAGDLTGAVTGNVTGNVTGKVTGDADSGVVEADTLGITGFADGVGKPNLLSASVHAGKFATNAAADSLYWSDGTNWQQVAP